MAANPVSALGWQTLTQLAPVLSPAAAGLFLSPLSLYIALVLALNGAGLPSTTQRQLWAVLQQQALPANFAAGNVRAAEAQFNGDVGKLQQMLLVKPGNGTELIIANALWTRGIKLRREYQSSMQSLFQATVAAVQSAAPINAWAAKVTKGLITQVIPLDTPFNLVITNAVYFKGQWLYGFKKEATRAQPFTTRANAKVQVPMMTKRFKNEGDTRPVLYTNTSAWSGVKLPYRGSNLSAVILLPKDPKAVTPSAQVAQALLLKGWYAPSSVDVSLPRFKIKNDLQLTAPLRALGLVAPLDPRRANFSRISTDPLHITDVLQSVVVQVDEVGTEAAAVTSLVMLTASAIPQEPPRVVFDRPFLFNIVDDTTNTVLFQGWVTDPSKSSP